MARPPQPAKGDWSQKTAAGCAARSHGGRRAARLARRLAGPSADYGPKTEANHMKKSRLLAGRWLRSENELTSAARAALKTPHYRSQRGLSAAKAERLKRGRFACKPASGARFSEDERRTRETDVRMVLGTFCHQKVQRHRLAEQAGRSHRRRRPATLRVLSFAGCVRAQIENGNWLPPIIHCSLAAPAAQPVAAPGRRAALSAKPSERLRRLRSENTPWQSKTCGPQPPRAKARNSRCSCRPSLAAACPFGVSLHLSLLTFYFITFYFSCERACFCARLFVSLPYLKSA